MQWFDGGEAVLTSVGQQYNYTVECEFGRYGLWKVSQSWYRDDLDTTILLKATWRETCAAAQQLAEAWENVYDQSTRSDNRSHNNRVRAAARNTRGTRKKLARSFASQGNRSYR